MNVNSEETYQFAIVGGVLELSFEEEDVLQLVVRAAGETNTESGSPTESEPDAENCAVQADVRTRAHATVLVEESVVSFAAHSLRVIVWKYPLSVQVLTESGDWLLRVESIEINPGEEGAKTFPERPIIRLTAERSADDVVEVDVTHHRWLLHRREKTLYGIRLPQRERTSIKTTSHLDTYSLTANGQTLSLTMLYGHAIERLKLV